MDKMKYYLLMTIMSLTTIAMLAAVAMQVYMNGAIDSVLVIMIPAYTGLMVIIAKQCNGKKES